MTTKSQLLTGMYAVSGRRTNPLLTATAALLAAGCTTSRSAPHDAFDLSFAETYPSADHRLVVSTEPSSAWWKSTNDPVLGQLVEEGLSKNNTLLGSVERINAARAIAAGIGVEKRPSVDVGAGGVLSRQAPASLPFPGLPEGLETPASAGLTLAWEVDLFGRIDALQKGAKADIQVAQSAFEDLARVLAAEIAQAYIDLREAEARIQVANLNLHNQQRTLSITTQRFSVGRASRVDTERVKAQVAITRASIPELEARATAARNRLSTLLGQQPGDKTLILAPNAAQIPALPEIAVVGTPEGLISRRPDVRAAKQRVLASLARAKAADLARYPRLSINGGLGLNAFDPSDFVSTDAIDFALGPFLSWRIFDRRGLQADIERADATATEALYAYREQVLVALQEVDTSLNDYQKLAEQSAVLAIATASATKAADLMRARYDVGREDLLEVLDAERVKLTTEDSYVRNQAARSRAQVSLYRALAGGWGPDPKVSS